MKLYRIMQRGWTTPYFGTPAEIRAGYIHLCFRHQVPLMKTVYQEGEVVVIEPKTIRGTVYLAYSDKYHDIFPRLEGCIYARDILDSWPFGK